MLKSRFFKICSNMFKRWTFLALIFTAILNSGSSHLLAQQNDFLTTVQEIESKQISLKEWNSQTENGLIPSSHSPQNEEEIPATIEFKAGYFFFSNDKMQDVFDQGGLDLQICGSYPIWRWIQIYGSVEYISRHGRSLKGHQRTSIWEIPLSLGPKLVARINPSAHYYFTMGPRYFFVHVHNHSSFVDKNVSQNGIGGFVSTGFNFFPIPHLLIDIFGEYSYCRLHFHPSKKNVYGEAAQVGGFTFGVGLGYAF